MEIVVVGQFELMEHIIHPEDIKAHVLSGRSKIIVENKITGNRFAYKIQMDMKNTELYFVHCLNWSGMTCIGVLHYGYMRTDFVIKRGLEGEIEAKAFSWLWKMVLKIPVKLPEYVIVSHTGYCARCGRPLIDEQSIERGFGPECWKLIN